MLLSCNYKRIVSEIRIKTSRDPAAWEVQFCSFVLLVFVHVDSHGISVPLREQSLGYDTYLPRYICKECKKVRLFYTKPMYDCAHHTSWWRASWIGLREANVAGVSCFFSGRFSAMIFLLVITCTVTSARVSFHKTCVHSMLIHCCRNLFCKPNHCFHALLLAF